MTQLPPVTLGLLVAIALGYVAQMWFGDVLLIKFALWPIAAEGGQASFGLDTPRFFLWQLITYAFLHGNYWHIFMNAFALWMFGPSIERLLGSRAFFIYWFVCVAGAGVAQLLTSWLDSSVDMIPTIGASGGVFGLLLAFGMFYPKQRILLLIPPIPMPAWLFVSLYGALELVLGMTRTQSGVAHFAHLGGMVTGFVLIQYWRGRLPIRPRRVLRR
jgi:membrane associated rhomboid family serine protease